MMQYCWGILVLLCSVSLLALREKKNPPVLFGLYKGDVRKGEWIQIKREKGNLNLCHRCFLWKGNSNCCFAKWTKWNICDFLFSFFKTWVSSVSPSLRDAYGSSSCFHCLLTSAVLDKAFHEKKTKKNESTKSSLPTCLKKLLDGPGWAGVSVETSLQFRWQWEAAMHSQHAWWVFKSRKKEGILKKSCYILIIFWYSLNKWPLISSGYSGLYKWFSKLQPREKS